MPINIESPFLIPPLLCRHRDCAAACLAFPSARLAFPSARLAFPSARFAVMPDCKIHQSRVRPILFRRAPRGLGEPPPKCMVTVFTDEVLSPVLKLYVIGY